MSNIGSVSGIGSQFTAAQPFKTTKIDDKNTFAGAVKGFVEGINGDQRNSAVAIQDLISGRSADIVPVVNAVAKADLSFKLLLGVRNKVIEAYKQTVNMQV